jgi:hypothetical protein
MNIKCAIVPNAPDKTDSLITRALDGKGSKNDPNLICGKCEAVLVERANPVVRLMLRVACFECLSVNDLNSVNVG